MNEEYCPYCDQVTKFEIKETVANNGKIVCEHCGKMIQACSICKYRGSGKHCNTADCFVLDETLEV